MRVLLYYLVLALSFRAYGAETGPTVAIAKFQNLGSDTNDAHWAISLGLHLARRLSDSDSIQVTTEQTVEYGIQKLGLLEQDQIKPNEVQALCSLLHLDGFIMGKYLRTNSMWSISIEVQHHGSETTYHLKNMVGENPFQLLNQMTSEIFTLFRASDSEKAKAYANEIANYNLEAVSGMSMTFERLNRGGLPADAIDELHGVISKASSPPAAQALLANIYLGIGDVTNAVLLSKATVEKFPKIALAHYVYAQALSASALKSAALIEFQCAADLAPRDADYRFGLGSSLAEAGELDKAVVEFGRAISLSPFDPRLHRAMAHALFENGNFPGALKAMDLARACLLKGDMEQTIECAKECETVGNLSDAVELYEKYRDYLKKQDGIDGKSIQTVEQKIVALRSRIPPSIIKTSFPEEYAWKDILAKTAGLLTSDEIERLRIMLQGPPSAHEWARKLGKDSNSKLEAARRLFYEIQAKRKKGDKRSLEDIRLSQTAAGLDQLDSGLDCHIWAVFYTAMARSIGLRAYYTEVERDFEGAIVFHACALVEVEGGAVLVDLPYSWFGINHQVFSPQSDINVLALDLTASTNVIEVIHGSYLGKDWAVVHFSAAKGFIGMGKYDEADTEIEELNTYGNHAWMRYFAEGYRAVAMRQWTVAQDQFRLSLERYPRDVESLYLIAYAFARDGKIAEAKGYFGKAMALLPPGSGTAVKVGEVMDRLIREQRNAP